MIDINKKYRTKDGREVRIYATDGAEPYPVHGSVKTGGTWGSPITWLADGSHDRTRPDSLNNLVEISPYDDFKIDDPVIAELYGTPVTERRYFAGLNEGGLPMIFSYGATSWSNSSITLIVKHVRRPTPEELSHVGA